MKGRIKRFFNDKGYGFITGNDEMDYFFHISQVRYGGELKNWMIVEFDVADGKQGKNAVNIRIIEQAENNKFITCGNVNIRLNNIKEYGLGKYPVLYEKMFEKVVVPPNVFWGTTYEVRYEPIRIALYTTDRINNDWMYKIYNQWYLHGEIDESEDWFNPRYIERFKQYFPIDDRLVFNKNFPGICYEAKDLMRKNDENILIKTSDNTVKRETLGDRYLNENKYQNTNEVLRVVYFDYLYITTYQNDNYQFKDKQVNFDIHQKYQEIKNLI